MITFKQSGDFKNTERFLRKAQTKNMVKLLDLYGKKGVDVLSAATPVDTGNTAGSWSYSTNISKNSFSIEWSNSNSSNSIPVVVLIQYGHMANGVYVSGRDFINPAIEPVFNEMVETLWKEVTS